MFIDLQHIATGDISPLDSLQVYTPQTTLKETAMLLCLPPPGLPWLILQRETAPDEDPAKRVRLAIHCHWGTDLQIPKGVEAGDILKEGLPGHIAEIWALGTERVYICL